MTKSEQKKLIYYGVGALAVYWLFFRQNPLTGQSGLDTVVMGAGEQAGRLPGDIATGAVVGIGKSIGIPATNVDKCQQDIAAGDTWNASFDCTASKFLEYLRT